MALQFLEEGRDKYGFVTPEGKLLGDSHRNITARSPNYPARPDTPQKRSRNASYHREEPELPRVSARAPGPPFSGG